MSRAEHLRQLKLAWADFLQAISAELHMVAENIRNGQHAIAREQELARGRDSHPVYRQQREVRELWESPGLKPREQWASDTAPELLDPRTWKPVPVRVTSECSDSPADVMAQVEHEWEHGPDVDRSRQAGIRFGGSVLPRLPKK